MKGEFNFNLIGLFDITNFKKKLDLLSDLDWSEYSFRQRTFGPHKHTETVPLLYNEKFTDFPSEWKHYDKFREEISELQNKLFECYGRGKIVRCILVKLKNNSKIPTHVDFGDSLMTCHRHHIAVVTDSNVYFTIDNEIKHLKPGEIWEINNSKEHSVENNSDIDRIHIIVDWNTSY
jgi:hypothetical protein